MFRRIFLQIIRLLSAGRALILKGGEKNFIKKTGAFAAVLRRTDKISFLFAKKIDTDRKNIIVCKNC